LGTPLEERVELSECSVELEVVGVGQTFQSRNSVCRLAGTQTHREVALLGDHGFEQPAFNVLVNEFER
jgi:hypothetical protein